MNLTVDVNVDCECHWLPDSTLMQDWLRQALQMADYPHDAEISLRFVEASESGRLNQVFRSKHKASNVLSFPGNYPEHLIAHSGLNPLGDLVICPTVLEQEAEQQKKSNEAHLAHLLVHGTLHLLGYSHDKPGPAQQMEAAEIKVLQKLGFRNPYLIG